MHTQLNGEGGKGQQAQLTRALFTGGMGRDAKSFLLHLERE